MTKRQKALLATAATVIVPGSGYVILGIPIRGLIMLMWMFVFGVVTSHLAGANASIIGKYSGGLAVWALSVVDVYRIGNKNA